MVDSSSWISQLDSLASSEVEPLCQSIIGNRLSFFASSALEGQRSEAARLVKRRLENALITHEPTLKERDSLLRSLVKTLTSAGIDYIVFKTVNRTGWIGVDVDFIVPESSYQECIRALLAEGFRPIDDLSKEYATGLMLKGNSVVADLHTELAVLGVPYVRAQTLLSDRRRVEMDGGDGAGLLTFNQLGGATEAVVRLAHAVIKEGTVTAGEVAEVLPDIGSSDVSPLIAEENLGLASSVFAQVASSTMNLSCFDPLIAFTDGAIHSLAKSTLDESLKRRNLPFRIPTNVSILALIDHLQSEGELSASVPTLVRNLAFKRNAAYLGHTLLERLGIS